MDTIVSVIQRYIEIMSKTSKREEKKIKCISFLRKMCDLKSELFERFSASVTKDTRRRAWQEVHEFAVSIGLISTDKDFTYVRDTTWPNLRQRTMVRAYYNIPLFMYMQLL